MIQRAHRLCLLLVGVGLVLAGCSSDNNGTNTLGSNPYVTDGGTPQVFALFDPGPQIMPLPNDVAWAANDPQVCTPGTVCLPPADGDAAEMAQLKSLVNALELPGLSPNMFLTLPVSGAVDASTLEFLVFRTDDPALPALLTGLATNDLAAVQGALGQMEIRNQNDFVVAQGEGILKLLPKTPLAPGVAYAVAVRSTLTDSLGYPVTPSITMRALKSPEPFTADSPYLQLESLRAAFNSGTPSLFDVVQGVSGAATGTPWGRDDVLVLWTFHTAESTLSLTPTTAGAEVVPYPADGVDPFALTAAALKGVSAGFTANDLTWLDLSSGTPTPAAGPVGLPATAFLAGAGMSSIPSDQLGNIYFGLFQSPVLTTGTTDSVYFLLTMPDATLHPEPATGYPVVVFQHGLGRSKEDGLAIANTLAQVGFATLAIDAPLHGSRSVAGEEFFTSNPLQDRANIYHGAMDLWETVDVIAAGIDVDGGGADLDTDHVEFVVHSLGSIIGSVFLSQEPRAQRMVFSSPSALLMNVLDDTALPDLQALPASLGYTKGTTSYYVFLDLLQWLMDPVDGSYNGIGGNSTDQLLNVFAFGDPVVSNDSTKVFMSGIGLDPGDTVVVDPDTVGVSFPAPADFSAGDYQYGLAGKRVVHSFLLSPLFDPQADPYYAGYDEALQVEATTGAQMQMAGFLAAP